LVSVEIGIYNREVSGSVADANAVRNGGEIVSVSAGL
jgi:hypothetical protein